MESQERGERRRVFGSGEHRLDPRSLDGLPPAVVDRLLARGQGATPRSPWE